MVIRYNFHIENFTRYPVTRTVDSDVLESSLYIMKACPVMYTGLRQLRRFTTPIRLLIILVFRLYIFLFIFFQSCNVNKLVSRQYNINL
jgi:hypothetical protein